MYPLQKSLIHSTLFILLLSPTLTLAASAIHTQKQVIDRFISYSGYPPQSGQLPWIIKETLANSVSASNTHAVDVDKLTATLLDAYDSQRVRHAMGQQLSLGYDHRHYLGLIQKLEGQPTRKLLNMALATTPLDIRNAKQALIKHPVTAHREALITTLLTANGAIENALQTHAILHEVIHGLINKTDTAKLSSVQKSQQKQLAAPTESLRATVTSDTIAAALITYRRASDDELRQYIEFYNSAAGEWFKLTQQNGWLGALRNIGRDVAWQIQHTDNSDVQTTLEDELRL